MSCSLSTADPQAGDYCNSREVREQGNAAAKKAGNSTQIEARISSPTRDQTLPKDDTPPPTKGSLCTTRSTAINGEASLRQRVPVAASDHRLSSRGVRGIPCELPLGLVSLFSSRQESDSDAA